MADIKRDTDVAREAARAVAVNGVPAASGAAAADGAAARGTAAEKKKAPPAINWKPLGAGDVSEDADTPGDRKQTGESLALPQAVINEGVRVTRECLEMVCEIE